MRTLLTLFAASALAVVLLAGTGETAEATYGHHGYGKVHCVRYGETLYGIAWRYGTSAHAIAHANGIHNPNYVRAGQCLRIPGHGHAKKAPMPKKHYAPAPMPKKHHGYGYGKKMGGYYCVRYGDTLSSIAWRHGTTAWAIAHANGIYNPNHIRAGQCLRIPGH